VPVSSKTFFWRYAEAGKPKAKATTKSSEAEDEAAARIVKA
jgi:hypothetical protein